MSKKRGRERDRERERLVNPCGRLFGYHISSRSEKGIDSGLFISTRQPFIIILLDMSSCSLDSRLAFRE